LLSVALSIGLPRLGVTQRHALWSPDFPQLFPAAIVCRLGLNRSARCHVTHRHSRDLDDHRRSREPISSLERLTDMKSTKGANRHDHDG